MIKLVQHFYIKISLAVHLNEKCSQKILQAFLSTRQKLILKELANSLETEDMRKIR